MGYTSRHCTHFGLRECEVFVRVVEDGRANQLGTVHIPVAEAGSGGTICEDCWKISDVGKDTNEQNCPVRADVVH